MHEHVKVVRHFGVVVVLVVILYIVVNGVRHACKIC